MGYHAFALTSDAWDSLPKYLEAADSMLYENKRTHHEAQRKAREQETQNG